MPETCPQQPPAHSGQLSVLVPVLRRPQNVVPLVESFSQHTPAHRVLFLADRNDHREIEAIKRCQEDYENVDVITLYGGRYSLKIKRGIAETDTPLVFFGADDIRPKAGWFEAANRLIEQGAEAVGVNDLCNPRTMSGKHATHFLVTREYAEQPTIDGRDGPLFPGYFHNFVDDEFVATARHRGVYAFAKDSLVEHLHPFNKTAPDDLTYKIARRRFRTDRDQFDRRSKLWTSQS